MPADCGGSNTVSRPTMSWGLQFFDVEGRLVKTGSRTVKCATGYNLKALMIGSEGTLGVIDQITLKLIPPPRARKSLLAVFDELEGASQAVAAIIARHIVPAHPGVFGQFHHPRS